MTPSKGPEAPSTVPPRAPIAPPTPPDAAAKPPTPKRDRGAFFLRLIGVAALLTAVAIAGVMIWTHFANRPSSGNIMAWLNQNARGTLIFDQARITLKPQADGTIIVAVESSGTIPEPLYSSISATELLREIDFDTAPLIAVRRMLNLSEAPELIKQAGPPPPDPLARDFLVEVTPAGKTISYTGTLAASRIADRWSFEYLSLPFALDDSLGKSRAHFPAATPLGSDAAVQQQLLQAAHLRADYGRRLTDARDELLRMQEQQRAEAAARKQEAEAARLEKLRLQREALLATARQFIKPGSFFDGRIMHRSDAFNRHRIVLEIVSVNPATAQVSALLRNDGSWRDTRLFEGTWETNDANTSVRLLLTSPASKRNSGAGPILEGYGWAYAFTLSADGGLTAETDSYNLSLAHHPDPGALKTEITAAFTDALAASAPEVAYEGIVVSTETNLTQNVVLCFTRQENEGAALTATIELVDRPDLKRTLSGVVIESRHRGAASPIQLRLPGNNSISAAGDHSLLAFPYDRRFTFRIDGDRLLAEDDRFTLRLTRLTPETAAALAEKRAAIETRFHTLVKKGASYDGFIRHPSEVAAPARLTILDTNPTQGTLTVAIDSREQAGIRHILRGTFSVWAGTLRLGTSSGSTFNPSGTLRAPIFSRDNSFQLTLALREQLFEGNTTESSAWRFEFSLLPVDLAPEKLATYPTEPGAYLRSGDTWLRLPSNGGRPDEGPAAIAKQIFGALTNPSAAQTGEKLTDVLFDGSAPLPTVERGPVVIAVRGVLKDPPPGVPSDYPPVEICPSVADASGSRRAPLLRVAPSVGGFMHRRIPATIEKLDRDLHVLTTDAPVDPGSFAVLADDFFEFQIR